MTAITRCEQCAEWTQGFHFCLDDKTPLNLSQPVEGVTVPKTVTKRAGVNAGEPRKPKRTPVTNRNKEILRQYANGANYAAIALSHSMTTKRVGEIVRASGVERRANQYAPQRRQELADHILRLHADGMPQKHIATAAHTSTETIRRVLRENGVASRPNVITARKTVRTEAAPKVLELVKAGELTQAQIASRLGIAITTVERILRAERKAS